MKDIQIKEIEPCRRELEIKVAAETMEEEFNSACKKLGQGRRIPGFRPGKAPLNILKKYFSEEAKSRAINNQVKAGYFEGIKEEDLKVVGDPEFSEIDWSDGSDLKFKVAVDIRPAFKLKDYERINLSRKKNVVEEKDIDKTVEGLRDRTVTYETQEERSLVEGDWALVDYRSIEKPDEDWIEGGLLEVDNSLKDGVGSQLVGMKPGETRSVKVSFPGDQGADESKFSLPEFEVRLREVKKKVLPEVTDEWAKIWGEFSGVTQLREKIKEDIHQGGEIQARREMEQQIMDGFIKKYDFPLPPGFLDSLIKEYLKEITEYAGHRQSSEGEKPSEEEMTKLARKKAEDDLRIHYIIAEIVRKEKIEADRESIAGELGRLARQKGVTPGEIRRELEESGRIGTIIDGILRRKVLDFLIEKAEIKEKA